MMPPVEEQKQIWIGMVEVRPSVDSRVISEASGAFVNVLTWAIDSEEFRQKAGELMDDLRLQIVAIEKAEPLANRGAETQLEEEIARIASEVRYNPSAIRYSTFHTWCEPVQ
jgi:hypothetical protein